ncbi:CatB-related O-acetyltransferase [Pararhizobium sp. BT-229]|uniref:CatB-related O-acetyltransferase n=1 Tax=Pararhizobium sp. BT-229 TaxID=2986923 RepID=UPI0021F766E1|nr:CatB-related O-acetyltransferase [Pararhizobium sp. BT-229]MCV9963316.1 CatB-related O-acetyltransferase [Pararhizobium sp. BT-229]
MKFDKQTIAAALQAGITMNVQTTVDNSAIVLLEAPVKIVAARLSFKGSIGAYTYVRFDCRIAGRTERIGRYCSIAPGVSIADGEHPTDWLATHPFQWGADGWISAEDRRAHKFPALPVIPRTKIGNDVWIGANAIVLADVEIGDGAIVAAGSVVTKNVAPYTIVAGVPAKVIRQRFPSEIIARLQSLKWWRYTPESMLGVRFERIEKAVAELEKRKKAKTLVPIPEKLFKLSPAGFVAVDDEWDRHKHFVRYK